MKFSCGVHIKVAFFSIWFMRSQSSRYRRVAYSERRNNRFCHVTATLSASIYHSNWLHLFLMSIKAKQNKQPDLECIFTYSFFNFKNVHEPQLLNNDIKEH